MCVTLYPTSSSSHTIDSTTFFRVLWLLPLAVTCCSGLGARRRRQSQRADAACSGRSRETILDCNWCKLVCSAVLGSAPYGCCLVLTCSEKNPASGSPPWRVMGGAVSMLYSVIEVIEGRILNPPHFPDTVEQCR